MRRPSESTESSEGQFGGRRKAKGDGSFINPRAEIFRSKLIQDFRLLDSVEDEGKRRMEIPRYYSRDFQDESMLYRMLQESPSALVRFQVYTADKNVAASRGDRRSSRLRNKVANIPPLDVWANWVVESSWFQNGMLLLIVINSVVLGLQTEFNSEPRESVIWFRTLLEIMDLATLMVFIIEIILKWLDDFRSYWNNGWNVFDFIITVISLIPETISVCKGTFGQTKGLTGDRLATAAAALRIFRILRALKLVTRFQKVRIIVLAVTKAFKEMVFITTLLALVGYIFAISGVLFFDSYAHSSRTDLKYKSQFSSVWQVSATLFQLFTLDHWYDILQDLVKTDVKVFAYIFFMAWICIGSFIFHNIFIGIMVNNFQTIRNELFEEMQAIKQKQQQQEKLMFLNEEMQMEEALDKDEANKVLEDDLLYEEEENTDNLKLQDGKAKQDYDEHALLNEINEQMEDSLQKGKEWQQQLLSNLDTLMRSHTGTETIWPRATLFRYLVLMEHLMENLEERRRLIDLNARAFLRLHDH